MQIWNSFAQLKFSVYGHAPYTRVKQCSHGSVGLAQETYTHVKQCSHASVGLAQARSNYWVNYDFFHTVRDRNEPHVMTYCHITTKYYMTYDIKFSHIMAALVCWKIESLYREVEYGLYDSLLNFCKLPTLVSRRHYLKLSFLYQVIHGSFTFPNAPLERRFIPSNLRSTASSFLLQRPRTHTNAYQ